MSDYFDQLETGLRDAVRRRAHLPWHARLVAASLRHRGLAVVFASLVVATPAVAAVGAAAGWFGKGKPDVFYRGGASVGVGSAVRGTRMLPIRVADPAGGPPWGLRLVTTSRGATCVQVGRVEHGQLVSLGIDGSWGNDHRFHPISPNDSPADICGATDAAGHGFVSSQEHGWAASAFTPSDYATGKAAGHCQAGSPLALLKAKVRRFPPGSKSRKALQNLLERIEKAQAHSNVKPCPTGGLRMISVGLLGPDATRISYTTPSGARRTEATVGGVGAYLIVFKQTPHNCNAFTQSGLSAGNTGCQDNYGGTQNPNLRQPNAVTSVTYRDGRTCTDQPPAGLVSAFRTFNRRMLATFRHEPAARERAQTDAFLAAHGVKPGHWIQAFLPQCAPVGWVGRSGPKLAPAAVRSPLQVSIAVGRRFCTRQPWSSLHDTTIVCDHRVPPGYTSYWESPTGAHGPLFALIRVSFIAREPVTSTNSFYEWYLNNPGNTGGSGNRTQANVRRGERITFTMTEAVPGTGAQGPAPRGIYRGTIGFVQDVGRAGPDMGGNDPGHDGSLTVGTFSFRLPLRH